MQSDTQLSLKQFIAQFNLEIHWSALISHTELASEMADRRGATTIEL
jgi:hypothetical protein